MSTMGVVKWSSPRDEVYGPLCVGLYKEDDGSILTWSVMDLDENIIFFNWSRKDNNWVVTGDQYNNEFKKWRGSIHNGQSHEQALNKTKRTDRICSMFSGSVKCNGIPRVVNPKIPIKYYKDQRREHMIKNKM